MCENALDVVIIVFVRLPVPGKCKTRLAAGVGPQQAALFYKSCAETVMKACAELPGARLIIQHSAGDDPAAVQSWVSNTLQSHSQYTVESQSVDPDLGVKMYSAINHYLGSGGVKRVLLVGSDIPDISPDILLAACRQLDTHQAVFGPAKDGGYYLVGLTEPAPTLFQGISWSTGSVLEETLRAASAAGVSVSTALPVCPDIDTVEDLKTWVKGAVHTAVDSTEGDALWAQRQQLLRVAHSLLVTGVEHAIV